MLITKVSGANENETSPDTNAEEISHLDLKEMLVDIQITVSNFLRENTKLVNEVATNFEAQSNSRTVS